MEKASKNNIKLGGFVIAGVIVLMGALYFIGKNQNSWASGVEVRVRFSDLGGLMEGDNVLYAGMPAGSVEKTNILNDTTMEVILLINKKTSPYIRRNAIVSISSDGLIGDKVVDIRPGQGNASLIDDGDLMTGREAFRFDKMLPKMVKIGDNVANVTQVLDKIVNRIDSSRLLATLADQETASQLRQSLSNLNKTARNAAFLSSDIRSMAAGIKNGEGSVGRLLRDTQIVSNLVAVSANMRRATDTIARFSNELSYKIKSNGPINMLLTDTVVAGDLRATLINVRLGTDNFNQNMEALQHNFLLRGFFRNKEKDRQKTFKSQPK
jgi:phospholipid/cholesterol/gamma-HCH transport system substrate-binding protein